MKKFLIFGVFKGHTAEVFTVLHYWFRHIAFTLLCQLGFSSNYHYFYVSISTVFILSVY